MVAALALLGCTAANLSTQYGPVHFPTLEGLMGTSEKVFWGTVVKAQRVEVGTPERADRFADYTLTIKVEEAWKGDPGKTVDLRRRTSDIDRRFEEYVQEKTPFIFFVKVPSRGGFVMDWDSIRLAHPTKVEGLFRSPSLPLFSMDFSILRTGEQVITAARRFAKRARQGCQIKSYYFSYRLAEQVGGAGDGALIDLPIVEEMLPTARELILRPESFLPPPLANLAEYDRAALQRMSRAEIEQMRLIGADLLRSFKSNKNIELAKSLVESDISYELDGKTVYPVRQIGQDILSSWRALR